MVKRFEFATAQRIVFGVGVFQEAGLLAKALGKRVLVVTGRDRSRSNRLIDLLGAEGLAVQSFALAGEPTIADIRAGVACARAADADLIIALGGGSAMDGGKAIAALAANQGDLLQYLEVIGQARSLERHPLPCIAIPTTAGTGSEATRNAVLVSPEDGLKVSLRHAWMLPAVALVDPELTRDLSPAITASTGLDALTQLIEPFVSTRSNPLTDVLCLEGLRRVARSLRQAWENGQDLQAREDMSLASLCGGLALANAGLGAVHALAAPLGGQRPIPHGVACAALLPHVMAANLQKLRSEQGSDLAIAKFTELARLLTGRPAGEAEEGVHWVKTLVETLQIPRLAQYGLSYSEVEMIAGKALNASSMQANPVRLTAGELAEILAQAL
jgi:alcohol dehydrogenase class IV